MGLGRGSGCGLDRGLGCEIQRTGLGVKGLGIFGIVSSGIYDLAYGGFMG